MSTSSHEMQEELNSHDISGFTILHYAALYQWYNLQSLCPLLFSKGANPYTPTAGGKLTPLHLASMCCRQLGHRGALGPVRNGCAVRVRDCLGSFPTDHARQRGFREIALCLGEKTGTDQRNSKSGELWMIRGRATLSRSRMKPKFLTP